MERKILRYESAIVNLRIDHASESIGIFGLKAKEPRRGHASVLMNNVIAAIDKLEYDAHLTARPYGEVKITLSDLIKFYERFGFEPMGGISLRQRGMWRSRV